jgi:hypothetical protein
VDQDLIRLGLNPLRRRQGVYVVEIEPDNALATEVFFLVSTQWRMSFAGPVGLDYSAVHTVMGYQRVANKDRADVFSRVRAIEHAVLGEMAKKAKAAGDKASGSRSAPAKR